MSTNQAQNSPLESDSIDVIALLVMLWQNRNFIVKTTLIFCVFGVLIALLSPVKYQASTVFVPQLGSEVTAPSGLSSLASLAGIDLGSASQVGDISPLLYPKLSSNIPFKLALLAAPLSEDPSDTLNIQSYLLSNNSGINIIGTVKKYTIGLPGLLFPRDTPARSNQKNLIFLTEEQEVLVEILSEKYDVILNDSEGYVAVSALDNIPVVAAQLVRIITSRLQDEIIKKRLEKVQNNLDFAQDQYNKKKIEFEQIQDRLARFKDRNQNISSSLFLNELERIQAEYTIALNVVAELASQVESAKLQVNKDTPIFSVIEPVTVPTQKEYPKRKTVVVLFLFFGFASASTYILVKQPLKSLWDQIVTN